MCVCVCVFLSVLSQMLKGLSHSCCLPVSLTRARVHTHTHPRAQKTSSLWWLCLPPSVCLLPLWQLPQGEDRGLPYSSITSITFLVHLTQIGTSLSTNFLFYRKSSIQPVKSFSHLAAKTFISPPFLSHWVATRSKRQLCAYVQLCVCHWG